MTTALKTLQARVIESADQCPDLRALLMVGSQARKMRPADEWSELDLLLFIEGYEPYMPTQDWIREFGPDLVLIRTLMVWKTPNQLR